MSTARSASCWKCTVPRRQPRRRGCSYPWGTSTAAHMGLRTEADPPKVTPVLRFAIPWSRYLLTIPCINVIAFSFLIQNIALRYIRFIKAAKHFASHVIAFISQTTLPVASHQLIFHGHILIVIKCVTSPYLRIRRVLYHPFILQGWQTHNYSAHFTFSHCHQSLALIIQKVPMDRSLSKGFGVSYQNLLTLNLLV